MEILRSGAPVEAIILYAQEEYDFYTFGRFVELAEYSEAQHIPFYCIANIYCPKEVDTGYSSVKILPWKTYAFTLTQLRSRINLAATPPISIPYIFMNARLRDHRCLMMDSLAKYNVIDKGAVSWLSLNDNNDMVSDYPYKFKYWAPKVMTLSEMQPAFSYINIFSVPGEYYRSFMQLVTETSGSFNAITEKTVLPLFHKKPFLTLGGYNHHKMLQDYGFQLYDEIFDYSYHSLHNITDRSNALAMQMADIAKKPIRELEAMREIVKPKLEFNAELARKLSLDIGYIPDMILDSYKDPSNMYCSRDLVEFVINNQRSAV